MGVEYLDTCLPGASIQRNCNRKGTLQQQVGLASSSTEAENHNAVQHSIGASKQTLMQARVFRVFHEHGPSEGCLQADDNHDE